MEVNTREVQVKGDTLCLDKNSKMSLGKFLSEIVLGGPGPGTVWRSRSRDKRHKLSGRS